MRPVPPPERSDRSFTVWALITCQSGAVSPSPVPLIGSLLATERAQVIDDGSEQLSAVV